MITCVSHFEAYQARISSRSQSGRGDFTGAVFKNDTAEDTGDNDGSSFLLFLWHV